MGACGMHVPSPNHMPWNQSVKCFKVFQVVLPAWNAENILFKSVLHDASRTNAEELHQAKLQMGATFPCPAALFRALLTSPQVPAQCCMTSSSLCAFLGSLIALLFWPDPSSMFVCFLVFWGLRLIMQSNMILFIIVLALCKCHALSFAFLFVILFCLVSSQRDWPCAQMSFNLV